MATERHTAALVVGLALGGLAGAGYVLFKTPRSGKDIRAGLAARARGLVGAVRETVEVVGVETLRAGEQTVEKLGATGAAARDRIPAMPSISGVSDLIPGNRSEPDTPASADEITDAIAGDAIEAEAEEILQPVPAPSVFAATGSNGAGAYATSVPGDDSSPRAAGGSPPPPIDP